MGTKGQNLDQAGNAQDYRKKKLMPTYLSIGTIGVGE